MNTSFPWLNTLTANYQTSSPLNSEILRNFYQHFNECVSTDQITAMQRCFATSDDLLNQFHLIIYTSEFARQQILRTPANLLWLLENVVCADIDYQRELSAIQDKEEKGFDQALRHFRNRQMLRIIWRDFNRLADLKETMSALSALANAAICAAVNFHYERLIQRYGVPRNTAGKQQPLIVIGMGKLGADELNLSSDIDLIFAYPEKGETDNSKRALCNQEFFIRAGKKIIQSLDTVTADGFVFRVDMRLRPYGQSGALVYSYDALLEYYQTQGREWERYAMVKAMVVANNGDPHYTTELHDLLRNFTYRRYIDFSVVDALRKLKQMIAQEVQRRGLDNDIKLGFGGIREIEFIAQVFQLIRGGRERSLQINKILSVLPLLVEHNCLVQDKVDVLTEAYLFLRNCEHAIQGYADEQTQTLPSDHDRQNALLAVMRQDSWQAFKTELDGHRQRVRTIFSDIIEPSEVNNSTPKNSTFWQGCWGQHVTAEQLHSTFEDHGHESPTQSAELITELRAWSEQNPMHATSRERIDNFMPVLLASLSRFSKPTEILQRIAPLIKSVARRSAYLMLLVENPGALGRLLKLSEASPWIAEKMAEMPALLDELLDPEALFNPPEKAVLASELRRTVLRIAEDDLETQMDTLRYFRSSHALRVACAEITGVLPLMKVSDYLTAIAEVIVDYVLQISWKVLVGKHGYPDDKLSECPDFAIIGYGKLGGIELSHGSDLDLVFIHNASLNGVTGGSRSIDNQTFYTRLGQKIIHFVTTNMASGALYEVDMRLRPSGNSGMLVTSIDSFEKYQHQSAWTWEHQALVRARFICGNKALADRFTRVRDQILLQRRNLANLRQDVVTMRDKMRDHLGSHHQGDGFHLKHDAGGIVDIEFMVQYSVLAWAHSHPELAKFTDNIRILESLATSDLLDTHEVHQLIDAYKALRAAGHRLTLQQQPSVVSAEAFVNEKRAIKRIWDKLMGETSTQDSTDTNNTIIDGKKI